MTNITNTVRISDIIVPEIFQEYMAEKTVETAALWNAGIVQADEKASSLLTGGGTTFQMPFWTPLSTAEPTPVDDNPVNKLATDKIATAKQVSIRQLVAKSWSTMDYASLKAGDDAMEAIANKMTEDYWNPVLNRRVYKTLSGVIKDNVANDSGDMVVDKAATGTTVAASNKISVDNIADALQSLGDMRYKVNTIIMHSALQTSLFKANSDKNTSMNMTDQNGVMHTNGLRIVIDDNCPFTAATTGASAKAAYYTCYLVGDGLFGWGEGSPSNTPSIEFERDPQAGNGGGADVIVSRRHFILHPKGFQWAGAATIGNPTEANLDVATSWDRVFNRKNIPLVALHVNA